MSRPVLPIVLKGDIETNEVWMFGEKLDLKKSLKLRNHSPSGFCWGYGGSGPSQLALAICLEIYPEDEALSKYQDFKKKYIATIPMKSFDERIIEVEL